MVKIMKDICIRMRELRKELELSQVEFAKNLGVTNAHISKIERGGTIPSDSLIKLISKEYQVNENWLKIGEEPMFIDEILDKTEEYLINSTTQFSKLLSSDSYMLRGVAAELNFYFSSITDVSLLNEKQKLEYLTIVKNMFSLINQYNLMIKDSLASKQMLINDVFLEVYKKGIEKSICEFINLIDS